MENEPKDRYRLIIEKAAFGFAYHEIILDAAGKAADYRFLEVNEAFEAMTGLKKTDVEGKTVRETLPAIDQGFDWISFYGEIAQNGGIGSLEEYSLPLDRWYRIQAASFEQGFFYTLFIDITEDKKRNDELEGFFTTNLDLLCIADTEGHFIKINQEWERTLDYRIEDLVGKKFLDFVHPEDLESTLSAMARLDSGQAVLNFINRYRKKDGSYRHIEWRSKPKGNLIYAAARDITDRLYSERTVKESEANFRTFFETMEDIIMVGDRDGCIFYTNTAAVRKLGYTPEELNGMHVLDVHPKEKRREAESIFADMFAGKRDYCPLPLARKDGTLLPVETRVWFGSWDGKSCIFGISKDIAKEQAALQRFNKIFNKNPALMALSSIADRKYLDVNEAFLEKLGFAREEVIGRTAEELRILLNPDILRSAFESTVRTGQLRDLEMDVRTKGGAVLSGLFFAETMESQDEQFLLTVMVDVTAQKRAEEELRKKKDEAELLAEHAQAGNKAKSEFLANMSHEIRTPLNGVIGYTDLLLKTRLDPLQAQYADNAHTAGNSLLDIINDILDFSKIEAGKLELECLPTDLRRLLGQVMQMIEYQSSSKGLELLLDIARGVPRSAIVDPVRVKQILVNLLTNAVKFTGEGEVELKVEFRPAGDGVGRFRFSVRDTGIGISQEKMGALFKVFSQADGSTTRKYGGTGLGLIISNSLAKKMGSRIEVESSVGTGSIFSFEIETKYIQEEAEGEKNPIEGKALIVDGNSASRSILRDMLGSWGIEAEECDDGLTALRKLKGAERFTLLVIDHNLPFIDGTEIIRLVREKNGLSPERLKIVVLRRSTDDDALQERWKPYAILADLVKPVQSDELLQALRSKPAASVPGTESLEKPDGSGHPPDPSSPEKAYVPSILIAEDVPMNMALVKALLKTIIPGAVLHEAKNGIEALDAAKRENLDLILMDMQMPEMDGLESTRRIRESELDGSRHVPIIALTASALTEERDKCLAAGMDAFLTKPIRSANLAGTLKAYLHLEVPSSISAVAVRSPNASMTFDKEELLGTIHGDTVLYKELLNAAATLDPLVHSLVSRCAAHDRTTANQLAHKLKGSSMTMKFNALARIAEGIEMDDGSDRQRTEKFFIDLSAEWKNVKKAIRAALDGVEAESAS